MYRHQNIGKVKSVRGKVHEYLSMTLYYTTKGEVNIYMRKYVKNIIDEFPIYTNKAQVVTSPSTENL